MKRSFLSMLALLWLCAVQANAQSFAYEKIAAHPRLLLRQGEEATVLKNLEHNAGMMAVHRDIVSYCEGLMIAPTVERKMEGKRLLSVSRAALKRIFYLAYAYRTTGDKRYSQRAEQEMLAAAAFTDWNPSHFLDVGEMTMALAIGYDWLYETLQPSSRETVRKAIIEKGFKPSYDEKYNGFLRTDSNWNQVCNAGLVYGALALFEDEKQQAIDIIERCMKTIALPLKAYAPNGAYPEGYSYWGYGTSFQVMLDAALESALHSDNGLSQYPGFLQSARYMEYMTGTSGESFNFSDSEAAGKSIPILYWFAKKSNDPSVLWIEKEHLTRTTRAVAEDRLLPCMLVFGAAVDQSTITKPTANVWSGQGITPVVLVRTAWTRNDGMYLAAKGGSAYTNHAHMDAGSFVFDAHGVRWAMDLGMQNYFSLEKEGLDIWNRAQQSDRWKVFRYNNFVHNTLTVNDSLHRVKAVAPITKTFTQGDKLGGVVDMTAVLGNQVKQAMREVVLVKEKYVLVTDAIQTGASPATVRWSMTTPAVARQISANTFELAIADKKLLLVVDAPAKVTLKTWTTVSANAYDATNTGTMRVGFETDINANSKSTLKVRLVPQ